MCDILSWLTRLPNVDGRGTVAKERHFGLLLHQKFPSRNTLDKAQDHLLALEVATSGQDTETRGRLCSRGTEFKGEGRTFNPNTPQLISQSASRIGSKPGGKRESCGRDRAGAMPGSRTKPGKASSERTTPICRLSSSDTRRYHHGFKERNWGEAYVGAIFPGCRPSRRC
jgi:hypothetical protein